MTERITREFGRTLISAQTAPLEGHRTVLRLLRDYHDPLMSEGGSFVEGIDGLRAQKGLYDENGWALFVNGVEADIAPAFYDLHPGDVVQWDLRDWEGLLGVRATVGAFPETFTRGSFGRPLTTTVRCEDATSEPCRRVKRTLSAAGVAIDGSKPAVRKPKRSVPVRAEVLVGSWRHWRDEEEWLARVDERSDLSGIFASFTPDAKRLRLLDWNGKHVRTTGAGTGLVGAMRPTDEGLMWLVTGVDDEGVERAARALNADDLRDAFAVAVTGDDVEKLPLRPTSPERAKPPTRASIERLDIDVEPYRRGPAAEPTAELPDGLPPKRLQIDDVEPGRGRPVERGDVVVVNYVGYIYSTKRKYDTSYERFNAKPLIVLPGRSNYIDGFEEGIVGMRLGGRRLVIMPPDKAYGERGYSNDVGPNETLAFLIDVERVDHY